MTTEPALPPPAHEHSDAQPQVLAILAGSIVGLIVLSLVAARTFVSTNRDGAANAAHRSGYQDGPQATLGIERDWRQEDDAVRDHLTRYAWVDRQAGIVRVPIDVAIDHAVRTAMPARGGGE